MGYRPYRGPVRTLGQPYDEGRSYHDHLRKLEEAGQRSYVVYDAETRAVRRDGLTIGQALQWAARANGVQINGASRYDDHAVTLVKDQKVIWSHPAPLDRQETDNRWPKVYSILLKENAIQAGIARHHSISIGSPSQQGTRTEMCGKFTAMGSWRKVWDFSQPLTVSPGDVPNEEVTYGVAKMLPVIAWNRDAKQRHIVPMRWGFPHAKDWRRPQPMHARSETIETTKAFADAFATGQRGIVTMKTFNEGKELSPTKTEQWTINPLDGLPRGFAFVWRRFEIPDLPQPMLACAMVTVPANRLLRDSILEHDTDPRMPAILEDADWATWLGENDATPEQAKAVLRTMEGVNWKIAPEPKKAKERNSTKARPNPEKPQAGLI